MNALITRSIDATPPMAARTPPGSDVSLTSLPAFGGRQMSMDSLISPGTGYRLATDTTNRNFADTLRSIQQRSGLDWGQIAQTLGVSRRTIHNWVNGAMVNGENAKRITAFYNALIHELRGVNPSNARAQLLSPAEDGTSPLLTITNHIRQQYKRSKPAVSARELLAYGGSNVPTQTGGVDDSMTVVIFSEGDES